MLTAKETGDGRVERRAWRRSPGNHSGPTASKPAAPTDGRLLTFPELAPPCRPTPRQFSAWLELALPTLRRSALGLTRRESDAGDLVQVTCLRALEKRSLFAGESLDDVKRWLITVMNNLHYDGIRKGARERLRACFDDLASPAQTEPPNWIAVDDSALEAAIGRLRPIFRETYLLLAIDHLSYVAIARRLNVSISTVGTRILRARAQLRAALAPHVAGARVQRTSP